MRVRPWWSCLFLMLSSNLLLAGQPAAGPVAQSLKLAALHGPARMLRDVDGIRHIYAYDTHDVLFLQGWFHAQDRLFQMDTERRTASGTLAELVGSSALASDVQLRTIGLRRAAERSLPALSQETQNDLQAYADGVNAWVAANPLPPEYGLLGLTQFTPWTALDSVTVTKAIAFELSFDDDVTPTLMLEQYEEKLDSIKPGMGAAVFFDDVNRSAPLSQATTVPDATSSAPPHGRSYSGTPSHPPRLEAPVVGMLRQYASQLTQVPFLHDTVTRRQHEIGSNEWAVSGAHASDGRALVANDPHLSLGLPSNLYDIHLVTRTDGLDTIGSSFPGAPYVVLGQNEFITWGETVTEFDVTDYYQERVVTDPASPSGLSTVYLGAKEPITALPVTFNVNLHDGVPNHIAPVPSGGSIPAAVLIVPRRNNGPLVQLDLHSGSAISVQYTGFSATRELDAFRLLNRARNLTDFTNALQFLDFGSENFIYGDIQGNIGYFSTGEVPLREDLQANTVHGSPPWLVRDGTGGNEWLRLAKPGPTDGTGYQYLPFSELPHVVNPRAGFVVNANNDPAGVTLDNNPLGRLRPGNNGIYYLAFTFDFGSRAGRITQLLHSSLNRSAVDRDDMQAIQRDVALFDAQILTPHILSAFDRAQHAGAPAQLAALGADKAVVEAVGRLRAWNYTTPTGLANGFDPLPEGSTAAPAVTSTQLANSVAATIYSVWRSQVVANGLDHTLNSLGVPLPDSDESLKAIKHLIERDGIGESTLDFFAWTGLASAADRCDFVLLKSLQDALTLLSSSTFATAFNGSTRQSDYLWGKLHRITFDALLGGAFNIPGVTPGFVPTVANLTGLSVDGGLGTVDAAAHDVRANTPDGFMFAHGPNRRYVGSVGSAPGSIGAQSILPGGTSGVLGDPFYANLLGRYLHNQTYPFRQSLGEVQANLESEEVFVP